LVIAYGRATSVIMYGACVVPHGACVVPHGALVVTYGAVADVLVAHSAVAVADVCVICRLVGSTPRATFRCTPRTRVRVVVRCPLWTTRVVALAAGPYVRVDTVRLAQRVLNI
jgi:hypothetical protein